MFKIKSHEKDGNGVSFLLNYSVNGVITELEVKAASEKTAYETYCKYAFDFLKFSIDDLYFELQKIRPNYFDNTVIPYVGSDIKWCHCYWNFLTMRESCKKLIHTPYYHSFRVVSTNITGVIPLLQFENRKKIKELVQDIESVSRSIFITIKKLNKNETTIPVC